MNVKNELEQADKIIAVGDTHGNLYHLIRVMNEAKRLYINVLIIVGDFGFFTDYKNFLEGVNTHARDNDLIIFFADGNHEDHQTLNALPLTPEGFHQIDTHIYHIPRNFTWEWFGLTCMALGGAYGVDRNDGLEGRDWFPEETITEDEKNIAMGKGKVDILFTHDAPTGVPIPALKRKVTLNNRGFPKVHLDGAQKHRELLGEVIDTINPTHMFHGHYHCRYDFERINANGMITHVHGLDRDDKKFERNIFILDYLDFI